MKKVGSKEEKGEKEKGKKEGGKEKVSKEVESVLEQLYFGRIYPAEQYAAKGEEYRRLRRENEKHYEEFMEMLSKLDPPLDKRFGEIMDERLDVMLYELPEMFVSGFRLGARIMTEVFADE